jgi:hypothetical protein
MLCGSESSELDLVPPMNHHSMDTGWWHLCAYLGTSKPTSFVYFMYWIEWWPTEIYVHPKDYDCDLIWKRALRCRSNEVKDLEMTSP